MIRISFKSAEVLRETLQVGYHPKMVDLLSFVTKYRDPVITSGHRAGDSGVHGTIPCRGLDLRSTIYNRPRQVVDDINLQWVYDPDRPELKVAIYHDAGSGNHIHLQVHPKTFQKT